MSDFVEKFTKLLEEKNSILCVGLDSALPRQRNKNVIPQRYLENADESEARLNFCIDVVEETADSALAAKPNQQYVLGFRREQHQALTKAIRKQGLLSILDYKLGDIGDTVESGLFHLGEYGYDAITFNPFMGNLEATIKLAHELKHSRGYELGIIVLTLTSNPEAEKYMRNAELNGKPVYSAVAEDVKVYGADGCVVGATGHVTEDDIRLIRAVAGNDKVFLVPGVGEQKGDPDKVIRSAGRNILINVGRAIIYSDDPSARAQEYNMLFNEARRVYRVY